jgi:hypothetical protein
MEADMEKTSGHVSLNIPVRSILSGLMLVVLAIFTYFQFLGYLFPAFKVIQNLWYGNTTLNSIGLMWVPAITFLLLAGNVYLAVNIFKPVKSRQEEGLVQNLVSSFQYGLVTGLTTGFFLGLIEGVFAVHEGGFVVGLMMGVIRGLTMCLFWSFICFSFTGIVGGLTKEFSNKPNQL